MSRTKRDVVVVGGGVIGLCTALELAEAGREVDIYSDRPFEDGASMGNAGMIVPSHVVPLSAPGVLAQGLRWMLRRNAPFHLKLRPSLPLLRWLLTFRSHCTARHVAYAVPILRDLSLASLEGFHRLAEVQDDFLLAETGLMMVYRTDALRQSLNHEANIAEDAGLIVKRLDRAGLVRKEPGLRSAAEGAILFEQDGCLDPGRFLASLEHRIAQLGGRVCRGTSAMAVGGGRVALKDRTIQANEVILAAGAWTPALAPTHRLAIQPAKGYSVTVPTPHDGPTIPLILMEDRVTLTPLGDRIRFGGTLSLSGLDARVDPRRVAPILTEAARYAPASTVASTPIWSGFRPASPDGIPLMGRLEKGLWVASGHGMMGVSLAPASGRLMADLILGRQPELDPTPFMPDRFA